LRLQTNTVYRGSPHTYRRSHFRIIFVLIFPKIEQTAALRAWCDSALRKYDQIHDHCEKPFSVLTSTTCKSRCFGRKTYKEHVMDMYNNECSRNTRKSIHDVFVHGIREYLILRESSLLCFVHFLGNYTCSSDVGGAHDIRQLR
jgi:hypothetical protein